MEIKILPELKACCPNLTLGIIECTTTNTSYNKELWQIIDEEIKQLQASYQTPDINQRLQIKATRQGYKNCGKEPNRYRPSAEALCRRLLAGKGLYQISTVVDLINLISFKTGFSIGAFDAQNIQGNISYGIGKHQELYNGIGRGQLNVEHLPILRDDIGGIGTPTSDEERTKTTLNTNSLLVNINGYAGKSDLEETIDYTIQLLNQFASASGIKSRFIE